jgi:hypothetical protein
MTSCSKDLSRQERKLLSHAQPIWQWSLGLRRWHINIFFLQEDSIYLQSVIIHLANGGKSCRIVLSSSPLLVRGSETVWGNGQRKLTNKKYKYKLLESGKQVVGPVSTHRRLWVGGSVSEAMSSLGCTLMRTSQWELNRLISSFTVGIRRSLRMTEFGTYQGAFTISRMTMDWKRSKISMFQFEVVPQSYKKTNNNSVASELHRPKLVTTFADWGVLRSQHGGSPTTVISIFRPEPLLFLSSCSSIVLTRLSGPRSGPKIMYLSKLQW